MESVKFIFGYSWDTEPVSIYNYVLTPEDKTGLKAILTADGTTNKKKFSELFVSNEEGTISDSELVRGIRDIIYQISEETIKLRLKTQTQIYINGNVEETRYGVGKKSGDKIKLVNIRPLSQAIVNVSQEFSQYKIFMETKSNLYEYIRIPDILNSEPTLIQTLIIKFINFTEFDTVDVWKNTKSESGEYIIKLNTFDTDFIIRTDSGINSIYLGNLNNKVLEDGNSNYMINKWVAYSNNLFITQNLTSGKIYLNLFDKSIGHKTIPINKNLFYPQFDSCNTKVLIAIKKSYFNYKTESNSDYNYQNILDLIVVMSKFGAMCKNTYPIKSIRFNKYEYPIDNIKLTYNLVDFPELTLEKISDGDTQENVKVKKNSNLANLDILTGFIRDLFEQIMSEYIFNPESEYSHNLPTFLLTRLYKNAEVSNKYFSFMFGILTLGYLDLLKSGDYDNFNFYVDTYNQIKTSGLVSNPSELFYQFVYGFIAKPEQLELVEAVTEDLCGKFESLSGGFKFENVHITKSRKTQESNGGRIHNLIMGGGKTSMVTPLAVLRTFHILNQGKKSDEAIYLILPSQLVVQSSMALSQYLTNFFPVLVSVLEESRNSTNNNTWNKSLSSIKCNIRHNNLYILSDTSLKCGFINDYEQKQQGIEFNASRNKYIIDEIDTILNPLVSELNYPIDKKSNESKLKSFDNYFEPIFNTLYTIYKEPNKELIELITANPNGFSSTPHFNLLDTSLLPDLITVIKNILKQNYLTDGKELYIRFLDGAINQEAMYQLEDSDLQSFYTLNNFLLECVPTFVSIINRKNYGIDTGLTVVPFAYADTPSIGSEFSNPLIILCLTIIDYLVQIVKLNDHVVGQMIEIIKREYLEIPEEIRNKSTIAEIYGSQPISLTSLTIKNATEDIKNIFRTNIYFIKLSLKTICYESIRIFANQLNITGVDLVMYQNINFKSGFTGTPKIAKFYDLEPTKQMEIQPINPSLSSTINNAITQGSIISIDGTDRAQYLRNIYSNELIERSENKDNIRVLIDVGGVFAGIKAEQVFEMILEVNPSITSMFYWNDDNIPKKLIKSNDIIKIIDWNLDYEPNSFYYYDHKHTTGTDAKIPLGSIGLALIGKDDRYRDVAQGIFRMRKLTKGHNIIFVLNDKITEKIGSPIDTTKLLGWFEANETNVLEQHQKVMNLYNLRAIFKILGRNIKIKDYTEKYMRSRLKNTYQILNKFYYPTKEIFNKQDLLYNYIMFNTDTNKLDINKLACVFKSNPRGKEIFDSLSPDFGTNNLAVSQNQQININININVNISQNVSMIQKIPEYSEPDDIIDIQELYKYINEKVSMEANKYLRKTYIFTEDEKSTLVENYYYYEPRNPLTQNQFMARNMYWYLKDKAQLKGFWIYNISTNKFFLIPFIEGIKLIDYIKGVRAGITNTEKNYEQLNNVSIYDNDGNVHLEPVDKTKEYIYESNGLGSYVKIITKLYDPNVKIYLHDFYNLLFISKEKLNGLIEKYDSMGADSEIIKSELSSSYNYYIKQIIKQYIQTDTSDINLIKKAIDLFNSQSNYGDSRQCIRIINEIKAEIRLGPTQSELFEKIINFFTFDKKICYQLDNIKIEQIGGLHRYYYAKHK